MELVDDLGFTFLLVPLVPLLMAVVMPATERSTVILIIAPDARFLACVVADVIASNESARDHQETRNTKQ